MTTSKEAPMLLFISHCHADKPAARRLARRLRAHGLDVWMDEDQLRKGAHLPESLTQHVGEADAVVVAASAAAAKSKWVEQELALARQAQPPKVVFPFMLDVSAKKARIFKDHLGVEAVAKHAFEDAVVEVVTRFGGPVQRPRDEHERRLKEDLDATVAEWPALQHLVEDLRVERGLAFHHTDPVLAVHPHALDLALSLAYALPMDHGGARAIAHTSAYLFCRCGAGFTALRQYVRDKGDFDVMLATAMGQTLQQEDIDAAIQLLQLGHPASDQALMTLVYEHGQALSQPQVRQLLVLATRNRDKPPSEGFWFDAVIVMLRYLDGMDDLVRLIGQWIRRGDFDSTGMGSDAPRDLGLMLCDKPLRNPVHLSSLEREWVEHTRALARRPDRDSVEAAVDAAFAAKEGQAPWLDALVRDCRAATGCGEWDRWPQRLEMAVWVDEMLMALEEGRRWMDGEQEFRKAWAAMRTADQLRRAHRNGSR